MPVNEFDPYREPIWASHLVPLEFRIPVEQLLVRLDDVVVQTATTGELQRAVEQTAKLHSIASGIWSAKEHVQAKAVSWGYLFARAEELDKPKAFFDGSIVPELRVALTWFSSQSELDAALDTLTPETLRMLADENIRARSARYMVTGHREWQTVSLKRAQQLISEFSRRQ